MDVHASHVHHMWTVLFHPAGQFQSESDLSIVHPVKTTADGGFISHSVSHHFKGGRFRRDLQPAALEEHVYYKVNYKGRSLTFNLTVNHHLVSSNYILERRNGGANRTEQPFSERNSCHLVGTVETSDVRGSAAVSTCGGLVRGQEWCTTTKQELSLFPFSRHLVWRRESPFYASVLPLTGGICFNTQQMKARIVCPVQLIWQSVFILLKNNWPAVFFRCFPFHSFVHTCPCIRASRIFG